MLRAVTFQIINALGWQATKCLILKCQRLTERGEGGRGVLMKVLYREFPPEGQTPYPFIKSVFTHVASIYANLLEQKKVFT